MQPRKRHKSTPNHTKQNIKPRKCEEDNSDAGQRTAEDVRHLRLPNSDEEKIATYKAARPDRR